MIEINSESLTAAANSIGEAHSTIKVASTLAALQGAVSAYSTVPGLQHAFTQHSSAAFGMAGSGTETMGQYSKFFSWIAGNLSSTAKAFQNQEQENAADLTLKLGSADNISMSLARLEASPEWVPGALTFVPPVTTAEAATPLAVLIAQFAGTTDAAVTNLVNFWTNSAASMNEALGQLISARTQILSSNYGTYIDGAVMTLETTIARGEVFAANATTMATFVGTIAATRSSTLAALELIQAQTALITDQATRLAVEQAEVAALMSGSYQTGLTASVPPIADLSQPPSNGSSAALHITGGGGANGNMNGELNNVGAHAANTQPVAVGQNAPVQTPPQVGNAPAATSPAGFNPAAPHLANPGGYTSPAGMSPTPLGTTAGLGTTTPAGSLGQAARMSTFDAMTSGLNRFANAPATANTFGGAPSRTISGQPGASTSGFANGRPSLPPGTAGNTPHGSAQTPGHSSGANPTHNTRGSGTTVVSSTSNNARGGYGMGPGGRYNNRNQPEPGVDTVKIHPIELAANAKELVGTLPLTTPRVIGSAAR